MKNILDAALKYCRMGLSVIPVKRSDKRPYVKWAQYQNTPADEEQIRQWWTQWPNANIAIATGAVSGVDVVDCDSDAGRDALLEFLPDDLVTPIVKTPKGYHYYLAHSPGLSNGVRVLTDCDVRSTGGYAIAPPSIGAGGQPYEWIEELEVENG